jgi:hypothetical protein
MGVHNHRMEFGVTPTLPRKRRAIAYDGDGVSTGCFLIVMAGLVPAIHVFAAAEKKDVDARDKRGHDEPLLRVGCTQSRALRHMR